MAFRADAYLEGAALALTAALFHGLNGIRNICLDYTWGTRFRTPITIALLLLGIVVAYWGVTAFTGNPHLKQLTNDGMTNDELRIPLPTHSSLDIRHSSFPPEAHIAASR